MSGRDRIAVVGLGCWYPGADSPRKLWENVLARRREFRRFPAARLPAASYHHPDPAVPDTCYVDRAAVIDGFQFDWARRRIPRSAYESTDVVHWLALEVAEQALLDAGYAGQPALRDRTGVVMGNSLTGEQSRAGTMRLRWPFVRRVLEAAAADAGLDGVARERLEACMEGRYKSVFAPVTEDTLAGGLSNTIAGRICNFFDFHGGGYTVDGACSSSLLAVCTAAEYLSRGTLDVALAGGVDVSLDPFELVGFSKAGALARTDMRVYDRGANGFLPGEGCGLVVLKRLADAERDGDPVYAVLRGWGISSDGKGGITAPSVPGQALALRRAYDRAGYSMASVSFIEGHGTGTPVGDVTELRAADAALRTERDAGPRQVGMTSLKSIVGHTKAAAGVGGFIKAVMAVNRRVLPPTAACTVPNPVFDAECSGLFPLTVGEIHPADEPMRAGVSAMGFGGINSHATLESGSPPSSRLAPSVPEVALLASSQSSELFLASAPGAGELQRELARLSLDAEELSLGDLVDLASQLGKQVRPEHPARFAAVASSPGALAAALREAAEALAAGQLATARPPGEARTGQAWWLGQATRPCRIGFLLPGQGSQQLGMGRTLLQRFDWAQELLQDADRWTRDDTGEPLSALIYRPLHRLPDAATLEGWKRALAGAAQPAICFASLLQAEFLRRLGVLPVAVTGHSLGELTACCLAGAFDAEALLRLAALRGKAMSAEGGPRGRMASLGCDEERASALCERVPGYLVVANVNSPQQVAVAGDAEAVEAAGQVAASQGISFRPLPVANAFHSRYVQRAAEILLREAPVPEALAPSPVEIFSSTDGRPLAPGTPLRRHFSEQALQQVHFVKAVRAIAARCDVLVECGPGRVLAGLARDTLGEAGPVVGSVAARVDEQDDLHATLARLFVAGANLRWELLHENRLVRPYRRPAERIFIENPLERPLGEGEAGQPGQAPERHGGEVLALGARAGIAPAELQAYLETRGEFIAQVMAADVASRRSAGLLAVKPERATPAAPASTRPAPAETARPSISVEERLVELVAARTGYRKESIALDARLLDDLNLDSIKAGDVVAGLAREFGAAGKVEAAKLATATLAEVARAVRAAGAAGDARAPDEPAPGPEANPGATRPAPSRWVRNFAVGLAERAPVEGPSFVAPRARVLLVHEAEDRALASALEQELARAQVAVEVRAFSELGLPPPDRATAVTLALLPRPAADGGTPAVRLRRGVQRLQRVVAYWAGAASGARGAFALVSRSGGGFGALGPPSPAPEQWAGLGLAQSLHLENPQDRIRAVDLAAELAPERAAGLVLQELAGTEAFRAAGYDGAARRRTPEFRLQGPAAYPPRAVEWGPQDVVLVTGGAKGITARCVLELARSLPCRFALVGSTPREQLEGGEAGENLARLAALGVQLRYYACDLRDGDAVQELFRRVEADLGPVTGVIHGAGTNLPRRLTQVSAEQAFDEVAPKLLGAMHLLAQARTRPVKAFAALSSIIGATGMPGNGWYAYSNEALDLMLRELSAARPDLHPIGVAFGVWSEVGMGARLGSVERLERMGIGAIPPDEGARRFAQLFLRDPGCSRVVVSGPVGAALDTWQRPPAPAGGAAHFVGQPSQLEPGVELRCRTRLTLERDPYLADHSFRDNLLLPTVFGLEAMAEAVAHTLGSEFPGVKGFEAVSLERPIVVSPEHGTEIELHVVVAEPDGQGRRTADVRIRTEQDGFQADCFSAVVVLGACEESTEAAPDLPPAVDLEPGRDLYGGLLFQGPRFQRLVRVHRLTAQDALLVASGKDAEQTRRDCFGRTDRELRIGDPFVRDALLQALQLVAPDLVCLPVAIGRIERFAEAPGDGEHRIELRLLSRDERELVAEVRRFDAGGRLLERLSGYRASVLEAVPGRATPEQMLERARFDRDASSLASSRTERELDVSAPALQLFWAPELAGAGKEERRAGARRVALPAIQARLGPETDLDWLPGGKPVLRPAGTAPSDVSLSHDGPYLLLALGRSAQGCDLQAITPRSRSAWVGLLGDRDTAALDDLARGGMSIDLAGTLLWAAREAGLKALQAEVIGIAPSRRGGQSVLFEVRSASSSVRVAATRLSPARGPDRVLAFCVEEGPRLSAAARAPVEPVAPPTPAPEFVRQGNRLLHRTRIPVSFREASTLSRRVHHTHLLAWLGKARELAMHECFAEMVPEFSSGRNGAVTNHASVSIHGELLAGDVVEIETHVSERTQSRVLVRFDFFRLLPEDGRTLVATGEMAATWVRILGPETVEPIAFPPYMESFLGRMSADPPGPEARPPAAPAGSLSAIDQGRLLHSTDDLDTLSDVLAEGVFPTSLVDANLVGNIYFANYFVWQSRVLDRFLHQAVPGLVDGTGLDGELACTGTSMTFLREAMPFDDIRVTLRARRIHEGGVELESSFFRRTSGGGETKIAVGKLGGVWLRRRDGRVVPAGMPGRLVEALRRGHPPAVEGLPPPPALAIGGARPAAAKAAS